MNTWLKAHSYRSGIYSFSGAPGVEADPALLDHRIAVEGVCDNMASFGGDPARIVLLGRAPGQLPSPTGLRLEARSHRCRPRHDIRDIAQFTAQYTKLLSVTMLQCLPVGGLWRS